MTVLDAAFWVVVLVLVAAGTTKLVEPAPLARALVDLGVVPEDPPSRAPLVARLIGVVEVCVGLAALAVGGRVVAAVAALSYGVFTAVVVLARSRGLASCGCFGSSSSRPSAAHIAVNACSTLICVAAAVAAPPAVADGLAATRWAPALVVLAVLAAAGSVIVIDTH